MGANQVRLCVRQKDSHNAEKAPLFASHPMVRDRLTTLVFAFGFVLTFLSLGSCRSLAAGFEELYRFPVIGVAPKGLVRGPDGLLYGCLLYTSPSPRD